jgi:hypothetical protein
MAISTINPAAGFGGTSTNFSSTSTLGASGGGGNFGSVGFGAAQLGLSAFQLANSLNAASDFKKAAIAQAHDARIIALQNNETEIQKIELTLSRGIKSIRARAGADGFSGRSVSTLSVINQQKGDAQQVKIQSERKLDRILTEITRQEVAAKRAAKGLKTKAITGFATSILSLGV